MWDTINLNKYIMDVYEENEREENITCLIGKHFNYLMKSINLHD